MWECELKQILSCNSEMNQFFEKCNINAPLNPRDAFYGGRTGPTKLYHKVEAEGERIDYVDVCR